MFLQLHVSLSLFTWYLTKHKTSEISLEAQGFENQSSSEKHKN